jgi:hypothetical protein
MVILKRDGRHVRAMVMNEPVNGVRGVVQCAIAGCEAYDVVMHCEGSMTPQIMAFMTDHECDPTRYPADRNARRVANRQKKGN